MVFISFNSSLNKHYKIDTVSHTGFNDLVGHVSNTATLMSNQLKFYTINIKNLAEINKSYTARMQSQLLKKITKITERCEGWAI